MSTGIFLCISYVSRYSAVRQRSKTQLEPPLQCSWHLGMLQSLPEPPLPCSQLAASSLAQGPPCGTGLCSSLLLMFRNSIITAGLYIFFFLMPSLHRHLHCHYCLATGGKSKEALCCVSISVCWTAEHFIV